MSKIDITADIIEFDTARGASLLPPLVTMHGTRKQKRIAVYKCYIKKSESNAAVIDYRTILNCLKNNAAKKNEFKQKILEIKPDYINLTLGTVVWLLKDKKIDQKYFEKVIRGQRRKR